MVVRDSATRQSDELVAGTNLEPWVSRKDVVTVGIGEIELLGAVLQAVIEASAWCTGVYFILVHAAQVASVHLLSASREHQCLAFLDVDLKIAWDIQVLAIRDATLHVLDIFNAFVPVGVKNKPWLVIELHVECGITLIHAGGNTILHLTIFLTGNRVLNTQVVSIAECQEWAELQRGLRVRLH